MGVLGIQTKGDTFVLSVWSVGMSPRDAAIILGDEESQVMKMVEQNSRKRLGLCSRHGASHQISPASLLIPNLGSLLNTYLALIQCNCIGICIISLSLSLQCNHSES